MTHHKSDKNNRKKLQTFYILGKEGDNSSEVLYIGNFLYVSGRVTTYFPGGSDGKVFAYNARDLGSIPGSERSGEGNDSPLQYSRLENPMNREAW